MYYQTQMGWQVDLYNPNFWWDGYCMPVAFSVNQAHCSRFDVARLLRNHWNREAEYLYREELDIESWNYITTPIVKYIYLAIGECPMADFVKEVMRLSYFVQYTDSCTNNKMHAFLWACYYIAFDSMKDPVMYGLAITGAQLILENVPAEYTVDLQKAMLDMTLIDDAEDTPVAQVRERAIQRISWAVQNAYHIVDYPPLMLEWAYGDHHVIDMIEDEDDICVLWDVYNICETIVEILRGY